MRARIATLFGGLALSSWALSFLGCRQNSPQRPPETRVAEAVDAKLLAWRQRRAVECHRAALAEAQLLTDTLIMDYALAKRLELARPSRPIRPEEPPLLRPNDTLQLAPFRTDTLIRAEELPRRRAIPRGASGGAELDSARAGDSGADGVVVDSLGGE